MQQDKFKDFKYDNSIFTYSPKIRKLGILVSNLRIFILYQTLQLHKFKGVTFKYGNRFFEFQPKNIQRKHFFVVNLSIFYFCMKSRILKNLRVLILKMAMVYFQISAKNTQIRNFLRKLKRFFVLRGSLSELNST